MIDAYTIGITLALDNGVSEGLATIRRDLLALNGVVDSSATRLKHLTRAAADLQVRPGVAELINTGSTAPARGRDDKSIPLPLDPFRVDPGLFASNHSDLLMAARSPTPVFSLPAAMSMFTLRASQATAEVETAPANRPDMTPSDVLSLKPGVLRSVPGMSQQVGNGATIADFGPVRYPLQIPSPTTARVAPRDESGDDLFMSPGTTPPPAVITDADSRLSLPKAANISAPLPGKHPALHPSPQWAAGSQVGFSQGARASPYDAGAWACSPSANEALPSATPLPTERQSTALQGDIYVDGSRLGRWMTDRLVKAADLPRAATTGFDPRMTATWPGAPVGA